MFGRFKKFLVMWTTTLSINAGAIYKPSRVLSKLYLKAIQKQPMIKIQVQNSSPIYEVEAQSHFIIFNLYSYLLAKTLADVIMGAHDRIVSSALHGSLEECVHHSLSSSNVLLVIWYVVCKACPSVLRSLLLLVIFAHNLETLRQNPLLADLRAHLLQALPQKCWARHQRKTTRSIYFQLHQRYLLLNTQMNYKIVKKQKIQYLNWIPKQTPTSRNVYKSTSISNILFNPILSPPMWAGFSS